MDIKTNVITDHLDQYNHFSVCKVACEATVTLLKLFGTSRERISKQWANVITDQHWTTIFSFQCLPVRPMPVRLWISCVHVNCNLQW